MTSKSIQIGKDLDNARCNGNWTLVPELARRFKKYNSEGAILEQTALAEMNLIQLLNNTRTSINYQQDGPYHITVEERIDPNAIKSIQSQLLAAIQLPDTTTQKEFTKIILARTHFESGEYAKAVEIISQLSFEKDLVSQGYGLVLFLQARSIKAMSLDLLGHHQEAIQTYEGVSSILNENSNSTKIKAFVEWSEDSLYRAILLGLREGSSASTSSLLEFIRQYQKITRTQTMKWRVHKRMIITRQSLSYCSRVYRNGSYCLPPGTTTSDEKDPALEQQFFIVEQSQLHTIYEQMLHGESPLPKAGQVNTRVLDFVNQFASDFELIGTTAYDLRGFVEVLDRASRKTFNSPLITRHLFLALVRLGEFDEAEHALHAYLYLIGLVSYGWKETRRDGRALATVSSGFNIAVPDIHSDTHTHATTDQMENLKSTEKEDVIDTLRVITTAIKMYSEDLRRGVDAVEMANLAKQLYQEQPQHEQNTRLLDIGAEVYRAVGVAYGLLGCQLFDPDLRPQYHEKALAYVNKALDLDPTSWKTYYQLALQQAEMHNIGQAVQSITQAIQRNPRHLSLWHLLTLLITCPTQGDFAQALKTCDMGLQQVHDDEFLTGDEYEKASQQMIYHMTRTLLLFTLHGPEVALASSEILFATFRKIAIPELSGQGAHDGMIVSGSLGNLMELNDPRRRGRSVSSSLLADAGSRDAAQVTGRARSSSNLNSNQLLTVPGEDQKSHHHHHHHLHGLHLFGSKSSGSNRSTNSATKVEPYAKQDPVANYSIQSMPTTDGTMTNASVVSFQSVAPSITQSILQPNHIPNKPSTRTQLRRATSDQVLSDLWILTAQMFIKSNKLGEARKAIEEAENVDWTNNPQVWSALGQLLVKEGKHDQAQSAFQKALVIDPHHVTAQLELAKLYIQQANIELAEGILSAMTKYNAWDCAEAWLHLGEIYRDTGRIERTKACLFYSLELESTTPIQPFSILPRYI